MEKRIVREDGLTYLVVGRSQTIPSTPANVNHLQNLAIQMTRTTFRPPRGVFKFKTHEEADAWMEKYTQRSPPPAPRISTTP
jgi:hypothetical protein